MRSSDAKPDTYPTRRLHITASQPHSLASSHTQLLSRYGLLRQITDIRNPTEYGVFLPGVTRMDND